MKEGKPYLHDLFDHMYNEHGLILTQSEMLEILCICGKEYDTVQFELGEIELQNEAVFSQLTAYKEALREIIKTCDTLGIDDHCLFPEVQEAVKLLNIEANDSK